MKSVSKFSARAMLLGIALIFGNLIFGTCLSFAASPNSPTPGRFVDVTEKLGIHFRQQASPTSRKYLLETMGSGIALFDYDNDGRLAWPHKKSSIGRTNTSISENAIASMSGGA